jgi:hypothetical protein
LPAKSEKLAIPNPGKREGCPILSNFSFGGKLTTLGLDIQPINYARPFFLRYADVHRQDLEREAYAVQTQPNSFELATSLLQQNCK